MLARGARPIRITSVRIIGVLLYLGFPCPSVTLHQYSILWTPARYQSASQAAMFCLPYLFYAEEFPEVLIISIRRFILSLYSPMMGQKCPQHVAVIVLYNFIVNWIQLFAFVCLNCSDFIAVFNLSTIDPGTVYSNGVSWFFSVPTVFITSD